MSNAPQIGHFFSRDLFSQNGLVTKTSALLTQKFYQKYFEQGEADDLIRPFPKTLLPNNRDLGLAWLAGDYPLKGAILRGQKNLPFDCPPPNDAWLAELYAFDWLVHICMIESPQADMMTRASISHWLQQKNYTPSLAWRGDILARRFVALSACSKNIAPLLTNQQNIDFLRRLTTEARYLSKMINHTPDGLPRLIAACGYTYSCFALANGTSQLNHAIAALTRELKKQVASDGLHKSRAPDALLWVLPVLIEIKNTLQERKLNLPQTLVTAIKQIGQGLKFMRHADGKLSVFQGGLEAGCFTGLTKNGLASLIKLSGATQAINHGVLSDSQYHRIAAGKTLVFVNTGSTAGSQENAPCAMELSRGGQRLWVNCGTNYVHGPLWQEASRQPAAHSMLSLNTVPHHSKSPRVTAKRLEDPNAIWLETSHDLYKPDLHLEMHRRLYVDLSGEDIRGEELIFRGSQAETKPVEFTLRFHLHPNVKASLTKNKNSVLLALPNREGWQFLIEADKAKMSLSESVYMGQNGVPRQTQQICLEGVFDASQFSLKWGLKLMR